VNDRPVNLRYSEVNGPGWRRVRRGRQFLFLDVDGTPLTDPVGLQRIERLGIPSSWRKVWICPYPDGHIQAVGTDPGGRRQYLYHPQWREDRREEAFDRALQMSAALPEMRRRIAADLRGRGLTRDRVLGVALYLLDTGCYPGDDEAFGITALRCDEVALQRTGVEIDHRPPQGGRLRLTVDEPLVGRAVRALLRRPDRDDRFLVYRNDNGSDDDWVAADPADVNARLRELVGDDHRVADLFSWHATVAAAVAFAEFDTAAPAQAAAVEASVYRTVAAELHRPDCTAHIDPRVATGFRHGLTVAAGLRRSRRVRERAERQAIVEAATARLIRKVAREL